MMAGGRVRQVKGFNTALVILFMFFFVFFVNVNTKKVLYFVRYYYFEILFWGQYILGLLTVKKSHCQIVYSLCLNTSI